MRYEIKLIADWRRNDSARIGCVNLCLSVVRARIEILSRGPLWLSTALGNICQNVCRNFPRSSSVNRVDSCCRKRSSKPLKKSVTCFLLLWRLRYLFTFLLQTIIALRTKKQTLSSNTQNIRRCIHLRFNSFPRQSSRSGTCAIIVFFYGTVPTCRSKGNVLPSKCPLVWSYK